MDLRGFERLLKQAIGLDVASIGSSAVERAVRARQQACGLAALEAYWNRVHEDEEELQQLIDAVVVPETWFFRDPGAFTALTGVTVLEWLRTHPHGTFRVLSVPCATGEEPYSLAMALLDAGLPPQRFQIEAFDVSERALQAARRGVYGRRSFRGNDLAFRQRYFTDTAGGYAIAAEVRNAVRFHQHNLLRPSPADEPGRYDAIFCRNLLIYFDRPTQDEAIGVLASLLTADGMLFVGPSETGVMLAHGFRSAQLPMAFAFRRAARQPHQPPAAPPRPRQLPPWPRLAPSGSRSPQLPTVTAAPVSPRPAPTGRGVAAATAGALDAAQRLADEGRFAEAAKRCEEFLRNQGPSSQAYYLLGLVRDAEGDPRGAETSYRKALYLDPGHAGALAHLALLMDTKGRAADAELLRKRVKRVTHKKSS